MKKKIVAFVLVFALALALGIGGTVAWLTATTTSVVNTFTVGDINITLTETTGNDYDFVPGDKIEMNPKVTVLKDSEDCYVFVKIAEDKNTITVGDATEKVVTYTPATGWTAVDGVSGVYWTKVSAEEVKSADKGIEVFAGNTVTVSSNITESMAETMETAKPTLTLTAYAIQSANVANDNETEAQTVARLWKDNFAS